MAVLKIALFFCLLNIFQEQSKAIVNIDPEKQQLIDDYINSLMFDCEQNNIAGMNLAIVHQGETLYTTGYGVRNLDTQEPVTENTVYAIASVSKHFTTTLLGQKLEGTGYTWSSTVHDILSDVGTDFYFYDPMRSNLTTLRDLASHSNGIYRNDIVWFQNMSRAEQASRLRFLEPNYELRTIFVYNNLFYTLLGHITEELVGIPWEILVKTDIYDKLGMDNSSFMYLTDEDEVATPYQLDDNGELRETRWKCNADTGRDWGPAAGITSTANDMAQWMKMLMRGGLNDAGEQVFQNDVILETQMPVNPYTYTEPDVDPFLPPKTPVRYENFVTYGLGLGQGSYRGYRSVTHSGGAFGHYTEFQLYPDIEFGVYLSINGIAGSQARALVIMYIADVILDEEPWLNATYACNFPFSSESKTQVHPNPDVAFYKTPVEQRTKTSVPKHQVDQFLGNYGNFAYGNVTVVVDDVTEDVIMEFDLFSCAARSQMGSNDTFYCEGLGDYWWLDLIQVKFDAENNPSQFVDFVFVAPWEGRVRFERELSQDEAPGPTDHWPTCEQVFPGNKPKL